MVLTEEGPTVQGARNSGRLGLFPNHIETVVGFAYH